MTNTLPLLSSQSDPITGDTFQFDGGMFTVTLEGTTGGSAQVEIDLDLSGAGDFLPMLDDRQDNKNFKAEGVHMQVRGLPPCKIRARLIGTPSTAITFKLYRVAGFKYNQG